MYYDANEKLSTHESNNAEANWWQQYSNMEEEKFLKEFNNISLRSILSTSKVQLHSNFFDSVVKKSNGICMFTLLINVVGLFVFSILQNQYLTEVYYVEKMQSNVYFWLLINVCVLLALYEAKYHPGILDVLSKDNKSLWWLKVGAFVLMVHVIIVSRNVILIYEYYSRSDVNNIDANISNILLLKDGNDKPSFLLTLMAFILNWFQMVFISVQPFQFPWAPMILIVQVGFMMYSVNTYLKTQYDGNLLAVFEDLERLCMGAVIFISISVKEHENSSLHSSKNLFLIQRSLRQISKFIDIICSEMKLPLTYVLTGFEFIDLQRVNKVGKRYHKNVLNSIWNFNIVTLLCDDILSLTKIEEGRYKLLEGPNVNFVKCFNIAKRNAFAGIDFGIENELKTIVNGPKHLIISDEKSLVLMLENLIVHAKNVIEEMKSMEMSQSSRMSYFNLNFCLEEDLESINTSNNTCPATLNIHILSRYSRYKTIGNESTSINLCTSLTNIFGGSYEISDNGQNCLFSLPCRAMVNSTFSEETTTVHDNSNNLSNTLSIRITRDMLRLKVCIVMCPNGFESCITNLFDMSFNFYTKYTVLSLGSQDIDKFNVFDVVFTEDLKLCKMLKAKQIFRGEIIFFHAKLAYMSRDEYDRFCDSELSAPCSLIDLVNMFEILLDKRAKARELVNKGDSYKYLPIDDEKKPLSHTNSVSYLIPSKDKKDLTLGKQFDYLPKTFMLMPYFRPNVQKSYYLWRTMNPTSNVFHIKSLVLNLKLAAIVITAFLKLYYVVSANSSTRFIHQEPYLILTIFLASFLLFFRSIVYKYVLKPLEISMSVYSNFIGSFLVIIAILVFPYSLYRYNKESGKWVYTYPNKEAFQSLTLFIDAQFGSLSGLQIVLHIFINNIYVSGWLVPWTWPINVILTIMNVARSVYFVNLVIAPLIAYQLNDLESAYIWNFYLVYLLMLYGVLCVMISYRFEYLYREEFKSLRKTLYSDYFMKRCIKIWSEDILRPLNAILDHSKTVQPLHELVKERLRRGQVTLDDKFFRTWRGFNYGIILLHGFRNQIKYKESLMDESEGRIMLSDVFKLTSMALTREIFSIASTFGDVSIVLDDKIDIHIKVDPLLTVVSCDLTMFRTILINAVHLAVKNVKFAMTINKYNIAQSINIQVSVCDPVKECELKTDRVVDHNRSAAGLLSFNEARQMKFRIFDTGHLDNSSFESEVHNSSGSASEDYSYGSHENICQDLIHRCNKMFQCCPKQCTFTNHFCRCDISRRGGIYNCLQEFTLPFKYNPMSVKVRKDAELMSMNDYVTIKNDRDKYKQKYKMWRDKNDNLKHFGQSSKIHFDQHQDNNDFDDKVTVELTNTFSILILIFDSSSASATTANTGSNSISIGSNDNCDEDLYKVQLLERAKNLRRIFESYYWNCSYLICNENTLFGPSIESTDCLLIDIKSYEALNNRGCLEITDKIQLLGYMNVIAGLGNSQSSDPFLDQRLHFDADAKLNLDNDSASSAVVDSSMKSLIKKCNSRLQALLMGDHEGKGIFRSIFREVEVVDKDVDKSRIFENKKKYSKEKV